MFLTPICQSLIARGLPDFGAINKLIMNPCALSARPAFLATRLCSKRQLSPRFVLYPDVVFKHLRVSCGWALLTYMTFNDYTHAHTMHTSLHHNRIFPNFDYYYIRHLCSTFSCFFKCISYFVPLN